jgi:hypothetical protein
MNGNRTSLSAQDFPLEFDSQIQHLFAGYQGSSFAFGVNVTEGYTEIIKKCISTTFQRWR